MSFVGKISGNSSSVSTLGSNSPLSSQKAEEVSRTFLDLLVDCCRDIPATSRPISPTLHEAARKEVFAQCVDRVLGDEHNPYNELYKANAELRESLIGELVSSHYLRFKKS